MICFRNEETDLKGLQKEFGIADWKLGDGSILTGIENKKHSNCRRH